MPLDLYNELKKLQRVSEGCIVSMSLLNRDIGVLLNESPTMSDSELNTAGYNVGVSLRHAADYLTAFCDCAERLSMCLGEHDEQG